MEMAMSLLISKNEFLCKFKGHLFDQNTLSKLQNEKPQNFLTSCTRCHSKLDLEKIDDNLSYLIKKIYDDEHY